MPYVKIKVKCEHFSLSLSTDLVLILFGGKTNLILSKNTYDHPEKASHNFCYTENNYESRDSCVASN